MLEYVLRRSLGIEAQAITQIVKLQWQDTKATFFALDLGPPTTLTHLAT